MNREATDRLVQLAEKVWDERAKSIDPKVPPHKADWTGHCRSFAEAFIEQAKPLLTDQQIEELKAAVKAELANP